MKYDFEIRYSKSTYICEAGRTAVIIDALYVTEIGSIPDKVITVTPHVPLLARSW